jgi:glucose/arabinose dehydrogenase
MALLPSCVLVLAASVAPAQPFTIQGPGVNPNDFRITTFATGLSFPLSMQTASDGSLLVTASSGQVLRFVDADNDGVADGAGQVMASGLPFLPTGLRLAGDLAFVHSSGNDLNVFRLGATLSDPFSLVGTVDFDYTNRPGEHVSHTLGIRATPGQPGKFDVFTNLGAEENFSATDPTHTVVLNGMGFNNVELVSDSIHMLRVDNTGVAPVFESATQIVSGVRNPAGIAFHPVTGDMYFQDNGIDGSPDRNEPLSADELNFLAAADIGGAVENYGFPNNYTEYRTGNDIGNNGIDPLVAFQPIPMPNGSETEGPNDIVFAPALFPEGLNNGIFVGFHGKGTVGLANEENAFVFVDLTDNSYFHFISNDEDVGPLDGLWATNTSLFIADFRGSGNGSIYQITPFTAIPEPSSLLLAGMGFAALAVVARRSRRRRHPRP